MAPPCPAGWTTDPLCRDYDALREENQALREEIAGLEEALRQAGRTARRTRCCGSCWTSGAAAGLHAGERPDHRERRLQLGLHADAGRGDGLRRGHRRLRDHRRGVPGGQHHRRRGGWSTCTTLIDTESSFGAEVFRTGEAAVARGEFSRMGEGLLELDYLSEAEGSWGTWWSRRAWGDTARRPGDRLGPGDHDRGRRPGPVRGAGALGGPGGLRQVFVIKFFHRGVRRAARAQKLSVFKWAVYALATALLALASCCAQPRLPRRVSPFLPPMAVGVAASYEGSRPARLRPGLRPAVRPGHGGAPPGFYTFVFTLGALAASPGREPVLPRVLCSLMATPSATSTALGRWGCSSTGGAPPGAVLLTAAAEFLVSSPAWPGVPALPPGPPPHHRGLLIRPARRRFLCFRSDRPMLDPTVFSSRDAGARTPSGPCPGREVRFTLRPPPGRASRPARCWPSANFPGSRRRPSPPPAARRTGRVLRAFAAPEEPELVWYAFRFPARAGPVFLGKNGWCGRGTCCAGSSPSMPHGHAGVVRPGGDLPDFSRPLLPLQVPDAGGMVGDRLVHRGGTS